MLAQVTVIVTRDRCVVETTRRYTEAGTLVEEVVLSCPKVNQ